MKIIILLVITFTNLFAVQTSASVINGDFETADLAGWQTDSGFSLNEGFSAQSAPVGFGSGFVAQIQAQADDAFNGFTLFQELDTTTAGNTPLLLSFDWLLAGADVGESFVVSLFDGVDYFDANGDFGDLFFTDSPSAGTVNVELDQGTFANTSGWSLEFQLLAGFDVTDSNALLLIDNISLSPMTSIDEPSGTIIFFMSMSFLLLIRSTSIHPVRKAKCI